MKRLLFLAIALLLLPSLAQAACGGSSPNWTVAATGLSTDLDACVALAVDGDTITFPAGTFTWTASSAITTSNSSITITGAAPIPVATDIASAQAIETICNNGGQTTYTCIQRAGPMINAWTTKATGNIPAGFTQLKNMAFMELSSATGCSTYSIDAVNFYGNSQNVRVHNNLFSHSSACGGLLFRDNNVGVVDHNTFLSHNAVEHLLIIEHDKWQGQGLYGDQSWASAHTMGLSGNLFIENNFFGGDSASTPFLTDSQGGARWVFRFNTIVDGEIHTHGTESSQRPRGPVHVEYYRNNFVWNRGSATGELINIRGVGSGREFDNAVTGTGSVTQIGLYKTNRAFNDYNVSSYNPWGYCGAQTVTITHSGTTATVTTPNIHGIPTLDANNGAWVTITGANQSEYNGTFRAGKGADTTHYTYTMTCNPSDCSGVASPATGTITHKIAVDGDDTTGFCLDQIGTGQGSLLSGDGSAASPLSPLTSLGQAKQPHYCWNNTVGGVLNTCSATSGSAVNFSGRDFYNINFGLRSARPSTCAVNDGYWSTDGGGNWNKIGADGGLDICTSTNVWTNDAYVPYTYPHPLIPTIALQVSGTANVSGSVIFH